MVSFIAIPVGCRTLEEIDSYRIPGVQRGTIIRAQETTATVVIWNVSNSRVAEKQIQELNDLGIESENAVDFGGIATIIEKYMP